MEPVPARTPARRRPHQPRIRAAVRDHGPRRRGAGSVQLLGARHRQHGRRSSATAREAQKEQWLEPLLGGRDPLLLRHDRAGRRLVGRHQHREHDRARRRPLRHQRPQMVDDRRAATRAARSSIFMGKTDPANPDRHRQQSMILVPLDDARREGACAGCRCSATTTRPHGHAEVLFENVRVPRVEHPAGRRPRLRDRPGPARARAASTTACARSAWPSARWRRCASA